MKIARAMHDWSVTPGQAIAIQEQLTGLVRQIKPKRTLRLVAGMGSAFSPDDQECIAAVILWDMVENVIVEQHNVTRKLLFPYIPGLLAFREAPAMIEVLRKLQKIPDVLLCEGHGLAHPRGFGMACHIGVIVDLPTIGCGKSKLIGHHCEPGYQRGSKSPLLYQNKIVGTVLRSQDGVRTVFVSVGHKIDLTTAEEVVL
ncbi:MAG: endonuclease V, partial [bacterium]